MHNYLPKIDPSTLCSALSLCSVRMSWDVVMVAVKAADQSITEIPLNDIANSDTYQWLPIVRTYSSGHVFIDPSQTQVYLISVHKYEKTQHQFTGWPPLEPGLQDVVVMDGDTIKFNIMKIEDNAVLRTYTRTGVEVTESYNEIPTVDWILSYIDDTKTGEKYWRLILLMHFVVKSYTGKLVEDNLHHEVDRTTIIQKKWRDIEDLTDPLIAPNCPIVTHKALEILSSYTS